jgi:3-oxoadipate enol-lactonase
LVGEKRISPIHTETDFVEIPGGRLAYDVAGAGEAVLFIHGGLAHRAMWDDQWDAFARHFRTIRYDMRGMGDSSPPDGPFAHHDDVWRLLDALGIERAHLIGLSFGGLVAVDAALAEPGRVRTLTLVASALSGQPFGDELMQRIDAADELLDAGDIDGGVELELQIWIDGPNRRPEQVDPVVRERSRAMNSHNYRLPPGAGSPQEPAAPARDRLHEITVPTLVLVGSEDVEDIHQIAGLLEREISNAQRVAIAGAAHHLPMEKPAEFNRVVLEFLLRHRQPD